MSEVWNTSGAAQGITEGLSGPAFCQNPDYGFNDEQLAVCLSYVENAAPQGFQFIFRAIAQYHVEFCTELYGVC